MQKRDNCRGNATKKSHSVKSRQAVPIDTTCYIPKKFCYTDRTTKLRVSKI